jgi:hypothetical protein
MKHEDDVILVESESFTTMKFSSYNDLGASVLFFVIASLKSGSVLGNMDVFWVRSLNSRAFTKEIEQGKITRVTIGRLKKLD